jgi:DNA polymerase III subunit alpha
MPYAPFVPLRVFSCYSMLEGAIEPKVIAAKAAERGFPAAALCDRNGLYAAMSYAEACRAKGVQPIIGALLGVARPDQPTDGVVVDWLALLAQDEAGYANLCRLASDAHLLAPPGSDPHVQLADLADRTEGLICLTAGGEGAVARLLADGQERAAAAYLADLVGLFPDRLYIELSRRNDATEDAAEAALIDLAYARDLPLVATNPACFADRDFHAAHDALLCIAQSTYLETEDRRRSSSEAWLKSAELMEDLFSDLPEALANTLVIAQRCAVAAPTRDPILPSITGDRAAEADQLEGDARSGLIARLERYPRDPALSIEAAFPAYFERLAFELEVITGAGFPGYFLIVADFIKWAKGQDIPVGPGRGSGAGSLVAWALTITDLDPIRLGLLFERFLNPERKSMPDFDIDFCETRRGEVIRYVQEKYGRDTVAQIITFGTMKARAVLKDMGRVLQMGYNQVDRLAKLIPNHPTDPWDLNRALNGVSELANEYKREDSVRRLFDMARKLEGLPRHSSTHAAGVVIGDRPLAELVPLYRDPRSDMPVTQFDMKYVEGAGLVKFDFLGLKTLSVLREALRLLELRGVKVDLDALEWDDEAVYALLQRGDTVGVFQLESDGMRRTLAAVKPTSFGDIIALVSLYRPGPMDNIGMFGARKNGRETITYPHPLLEGILAETYGIFVYQEQVMQAAQVLAGYSLGQADVLRRAMGKKDKAGMEQQRAGFVAGCAAQDIDTAKANELFDLIDKFAGYGFNKSHAAAYALLAYHTAWLKVHYPHEFFAASMSFDIDQTDKLSVFVDDMRRMDVALAPPCINASDAAFAVEPVDDGWQVRYSLGALKGVGERAMEQLVAERSEGGAFRDLDDFAGRVDPRLLNRRQIEALAGSGALDAELLLAVASSAASQRASGQGGLFGGDVLTAPHVQLPRVDTWPLAERMAKEKEAFGFYFSAHPVERFAAVTAALKARSFGEYATGTAAPPGERRPGTMAALVESVRWRTSQRGNRYMLITASDRSGQFQASCFEDNACTALEAMADIGDCALMQVEMDWREGEETPRVAIRSVQSLDRLMATGALRLSIAVDNANPLAAIAPLLPARQPGVRGEVRLILRDGAMPLGDIILGEDFQLDQDIAHRLETINGIGQITFELMPDRARARYED